MKMSLEKSKIMVNEFSNSHSNIITINGEILETVDKFKYLVTTLTKDGKSENEINIRLTTANSTMVNQSIIQKSRSISLRTKIHLHNILPSILVYGCEKWIINETLEKINAFESKSYIRILVFSYQERKTNDYVFKKIIETIGSVEPLI